MPTQIFFSLPTTDLERARAFCSGLGWQIGFMYSRDFEDPDGNQFGALYMDPSQAE